MTPRISQKLSSLLALRHKAEEEAAGLPPLMAAAERAASSVMTGEHRQRKAGGGEQFWQFRDYDSTDRPQDIDWRQSAKGDHVFIRQKEWQTTQICLFWTASSDGMDYRSTPRLPTKKDAAATLGLGLSILMSRAGELIAPLESGLQPGRSDGAVMLIGQDFLNTRNETLPRTAGLKIPRHAGLILIGDFLDPIEKITADFTELAARADNALVIQVLDPAEINLPSRGRAIFEDTGSAQRHHVSHVDSVRAEYAQRVQEHLRGVRNLCRGLRWDWISHTTDMAARDTLFRAWTLIDRENKRTTGPK